MWCYVSAKGVSETCCTSAKGNQPSEPSCLHSTIHKYYLSIPSQYCISTSARQREG
uniref:Uncharacterized protein n=1 Tax=Arundo donax TaxID=35708 RepID=A0A0A9FRU9_ARUDO